MENEYNLLEEELNEKKLKDSQKINILEKQKELLLQFLADSNKNLFNSINLRDREVIFPKTFVFFKDNH